MVVRVRVSARVGDAVHIIQREVGVDGSEGDDGSSGSDAGE